MATKMSSLMDLVSQNQPHFQTHQALLVIGMQNDFVLPDGRVPVDTSTGFLERIQLLIPKFRELNGNVVWVQTLYEGDRMGSNTTPGEGDSLVVGALVDGDESGSESLEDDTIKDPTPSPSKSKNKSRAMELLKRVSARRKTVPQEVAKAAAELDAELFLVKTERKAPACVPDTHGAQFADVISRQFELPADRVIKTSNYSAFQGTSLLMTLRAKIVTELYICGCLTNVSILATVIDGARHGIKINVIEDCLGFRKGKRHELALKRMEDFFDAYLINSDEILARETPPNSPKRKPSSPNGSRNGPQSNGKSLEGLVGSMSLEDDSGVAPRASPKSPKSPTRVLTGKQRTLSLVSVAESRKAAAAGSPERSGSMTPNGPPMIPEDGSVEKTVQAASSSSVREQEPDNERREPNLVKSKIRMRSKNRKKKKKADEAAPAGSEHANAEPVTAAPPSLSTPIEPSRATPIMKAESVANLREKDLRQQALKSVASVPSLSARSGKDDREKNRLSDLSDRVRLSLSRAPKSESSARTSVVVPDAELKQAKHRSAEPLATGNPVQAQNSPKATTSTVKSPKLQSLATLPVLGPDDNIAEGDSRIIHNFFPSDLRHPTNPSQPLRDLIFTQLYNEVRWQKMLHQQGEVPRLVCCQGTFGDDGSMPVYRHPVDETLPLLRFSPKVQVIRRQAEKLVGHPLNHVLIQMYRSGNDHISEHSDKTLDIVKGSSIVNVSFGAQRTMRLRTKKASKVENETKDDQEAIDNQRETQRVAMPHNSMFVLGLASNQKWLHGIMPDKRLPTERSTAETAFGGIRISLTFRHIGTFLDAKASTIWGQGASAKDARDAADVINGDEAENERMIRAFSRENHSPDFDWDEHYGDGFDVLHFNEPERELPILFASNNTMEVQQAAMCLHELKIAFTLVEAPTFQQAYELDRQVSFRDNDTHHTEISMASGILLYLDRYYRVDQSPAGGPCTAAAYPIMLLAAGTMKAWVNRRVPTYMLEFRAALSSLEDGLAVEGGPFIAGRRFSVGDCYVWPILAEVVEQWDGFSEAEFPCLSKYLVDTWRKKASAKKMRDKVPEVRKVAVPSGDSGKGKAKVEGEGFEEKI